MSGFCGVGAEVVRGSGRVIVDGYGGGRTDLANPLVGASGGLAGGGDGILFSGWVGEGRGEVREEARQYASGVGVSPQVTSRSILWFLEPVHFAQAAVLQLAQ